MKMFYSISFVLLIFICSSSVTGDESFFSKIFSWSSDRTEKIRSASVADPDLEIRIETPPILVSCVNPPSVDRFLYTVIYVNTSFFNETNEFWSSFRNSSGVATTKNSNTPTIYSCGNGKKLPIFAPIVHILNASWFLDSSKADDKPEQKSKNQTDPKSGENSTATESANSSSIAANSSSSPQPQSTVNAKSSPDDDWCMIVNFFSPRCPFSARLAPSFNALPRAFPRSLYIAAVDATESSRLNLIYGVAGTPTIILFHNGKPVVRYDEVNYSMRQLMSFVQKHTDLKPLYNVDVEDEDFIGPLSTVPISGVDYNLILAWLFITVCAVFYGARSSVAQRIWDMLCRNWREMEEDGAAAQAQAAAAARAQVAVPAAQ